MQMFQNMYKTFFLCARIPRKKPHTSFQTVGNWLQGFKNVECKENMELNRKFVTFYRDWIREVRQCDTNIQTGEKQVGTSAKKSILCVE